MTTNQISQEEYDKAFGGKEKEALEHALDIRKFEIELYWKGNLPIFKWRLSMTLPSEFSATVQRRRYAKAFKADIVAQCQIAGTSVARIARHHNLNANDGSSLDQRAARPAVALTSAGCRPT